MALFADEQMEKLGSYLRSHDLQEEQEQLRQTVQKGGYNQRQMYYLKGQVSFQAPPDRVRG